MSEFFKICGISMIVLLADIFICCGGMVIFNIIYNNDEEYDEDSFLFPFVFNVILAIAATSMLIAKSIV